jgi:NAD(P)-dependent dehydrogenase (short-subunit alcohol dehydrogenase family)
LQTVAADLKGRGALDVVSVASDLSDTSDAKLRFASFCEQLGYPDEVLLAYGALGDQRHAETDPEALQNVINVNFTSAAVWLNEAAQYLPRDKACSLIVIGSVAGDRGRQSNYVYGAAKAGLDAFTEGLAHRLYNTGINVLTVKPGFVDTPMTAHLDRSGPLWAKPEHVAAAIERAVTRRKRVLYAPWFWWPIMAAVRSAPRAIFYRTKL